MMNTGSATFGATSFWLGLKQSAVNMAQVLYVEFDGQGDQLRAALVFSLNPKGVLELDGDDAQTVQKWTYNQRYISVK